MKLKVLNYDNLFWSNASRDKPIAFIPVNDFTEYKWPNEIKDFKVNWEIEKFSGKIKLKGRFNYCFLEGNFYFLEILKSYGNDLHLYKLIYDFWTNEVLRKNPKVKGTLDKTSDRTLILDNLITTKPLLENPNGKRIIAIEQDTVEQDIEIIATAEALRNEEAYKERFDPDSLKTFQKLLLELKGQNTHGKENKIPLAFFTWHSLTWEIHLMRQIIRWLSNNKKKLGVYDLKTSKVGFVNAIQKELERDYPNQLKKYYAITTDESKIFADAKNSALHIERIDFSKFEGLELVQWSTENQVVTKTLTAGQLKSKTGIILKDQNFKDFEIKVNTKVQKIDGLELSGIRIGSIRDEANKCRNHVIQHDGTIEILVGLKQEAIDLGQEELKRRATQTDFLEKYGVYRNMDVRKGEMILFLEKYIITRENVDTINFDPSRWNWTPEEWSKSMQGIFTGTADTDDAINRESFLGDNRWEKTGIVVMPDASSNEWKLGYLKFKWFKTEGRSIREYLKYAYIAPLETKETAEVWTTDDTETFYDSEDILRGFISKEVRMAANNQKLDFPWIYKVTCQFPEGHFEKQAHITYNQTTAHLYPLSTAPNGSTAIAEYSALYGGTDSTHIANIGTVSGGMNRVKSLWDHWFANWPSKDYSSRQITKPYVESSSDGWVFWKRYKGTWYKAILEPSTHVPYYRQRGLISLDKPPSIYIITQCKQGAWYRGTTVIRADGKHNTGNGFGKTWSPNIYSYDVNDLIARALVPNALGSTISYLISAIARTDNKYFSEGSCVSEGLDYHPFHRNIAQLSPIELRGVQSAKKNIRYIPLNHDFQQFQFENISTVGLPPSLKYVTWWEPSYLKDENDVVIFKMRGINNMLIVVQKNTDGSPKFELLVLDSTDIVGAVEKQHFILKNPVDIKDPVEIVNQTNTLYCYGSKFPLKFRGALTGDKYKFNRFLISGIKVEGYSNMEYRRVELDTGEDFIDTVVSYLKKQTSDKEVDLIAWEDLKLRLQEEQRLKNNDFLRLSYERRRHHEDHLLAQGELQAQKNLILGTRGIEDSLRSGQLISNTLSTVAMMGAAGIAAVATGGIAGVAAISAAAGAGAKVANLGMGIRDYGLNTQMIDAQRAKQDFDIRNSAKKLELQDTRYKEDYLLKRDDLNAGHRLKEIALRHEILRMNSSVNLVQSSDSHIHEAYNMLLTGSKEPVHTFMIQQYPKGKVLEMLNEYYKEFGFDVVIPNFTFDLELKKNTLYRFLHVYSIEGVADPIVREELTKTFLNGVMIRNLN